MKLSTQIALSMAATVVIVGVASGEYERRIETKQFEKDLQAQADLTVSLMTGLMLEAIIVEDVPLLETALEEAVLRNPKLTAITIWNETGDEITHFPHGPIIQDENIVQYERNVMLEGEKFGAMEVYWSTVEGKLAIHDKVWRAQMNSAFTLLLLGFLFLFLTSRLATRPLSVIHSKMQATIARDVERYVNIPNIPKISAQEFRSLDASVGMLDLVLSERDEREQALNTARINADAASKAKSEFLATMSHEIRTPMNGVIGMAELILETELNRDQKMYAETISTSGSALLKIINDILDFSKIEAGKLELDSQGFDFQKTLEDIVTLVATTASSKGVEVNLRFDPGLPVGYNGDVGRIRQVITNIVGNAVKFTSQGYVAVKVSGITHGDTANLLIEIEDTGIGIAPDKITSVFNEFEQVDGAANRKFEGTGLGLAISTRLISMMGGTITATSELSKGSVFTISLPLSINGSVIDTDVAPLNDFSHCRVLIVDDLEINRTILSERLRSWNIGQEAVSSGLDALSCLQNAADQGKPFDLVIQDYQMPEMDGEMLARKIRGIAEFSDLPLVILSSVDQAIDLKTKNELKFNEVLLKPVRAGVLRHALSRALSSVHTTPERVIVPISKMAKGEVVDLSGLRVLMAEDNKTNQLVLKTMLKNTKCDITIANNGLEARDTYADLNPDVVLMDMSMPEMDGLDATREIRRLQTELAIRRVPIIALTANAMKGDRERCLAAGMDDYLSKPINKTLLMNTLAKWCITPSHGVDSIVDAAG